MGLPNPSRETKILRRERGQGNINFPCSANHEQDWQPYPVDPYACDMCDHTCVCWIVETFAGVPIGDAFYFPLLYLFPVRAMCSREFILSVRELKRAKLPRF